MRERKAIAWGAIAVFLVCLSIVYLADASPDFFGLTFVFHILAYIPIFSGTTKHSQEKIEIPEKSKPNRDKNNNCRIAVFTGRGANKNHAIFELLDAKGPLSISELQKLLNKQVGLEITYYASLNKRIHALEKGGYIAQTRPAILDQKGFKAALYVVCAKFYLVRFLNSNGREEILQKLTDAQAQIVLAELVNAVIRTEKK